MKTASDLRQEILAGFVKLKADVAATIPAGVIVPRHKCGLCGKPASLIVGRNSGRELIVQALCPHFPYLACEEPEIYVPSETTERFIGQLIRSPEFWNAQCTTPRLAPQQRPVRETGDSDSRHRTVSDARAAYRKARKAGRGSYVAA